MVTLLDERALIKEKLRSKEEKSTLIEFYGS